MNQKALQKFSRHEFRSSARRPSCMAGACEEEAVMHSREAVPGGHWAVEV